MRASLQPLLLSLWLSVRNRWERHVDKRVVAGCVVAALLVAALGWMTADVFSNPVRRLLSGLATYGFMAGVLVAGHAVLVVSALRAQGGNALEEAVGA
ncbi:hypothetical protein HNQ60_001076 [Povalibacter uvarum]|uniref:Uncharacterized protein n=2 Tax=Povalibacter uvarum TaxID=732238 RepID=A0A841HIU9_9GAMM|nr:hypothetical protein [Povalibacter uvarum]